MQINWSSKVPSSTYFNRGDCEPTINEDGSITVFDGKGPSRSKWTPQVTSTVVLEECDLVVIHVGFSHKYRGGQFWRYYTTDGEETTQTTWAKLPDETRAKVIDAYNKKAPRWANVPGKMRTEYAKPSAEKFTTYKIVKVVDGKMISLYDGKTVYEIGKRLGQAVGEKAGENDWGETIHDGGFYSHPTIDRVMALYQSNNLVPARCLEGFEGQLALIECEICGRIARFPNGKIVSTYLTPIKVINYLAA